MKSALGNSADGALMPKVSLESRAARGGRLRAESASQCGSAFADGQVDAFFRVKPLDNVV
jgi:hypothetical protein